MAPPRLRATPPGTLPAFELLERSTPSAALSPGPGWWLASDGKWYPPESAADYTPTLAMVPVAVRPVDKAMRVGLVLSLLLAVVGVLSAVGRSGSDDTTTNDTAGVAVHEGASDDGGDDAEPDDGVADMVEPEGFAIMTGDGIALAVPEGWTTMDLADVGLSMDEMEELYPEADPGFLRMSISAAEEGAVFMAIELAGANAGDNVNVINIPMALPLDELDDSFFAMLEEEGMHVLDRARIDHPLGPAMRVTMAMTVDDMEFEAVQVYLPVEGDTYVITITAVDAGVADQIVDSFRVNEATSA